MTRSSTFLTRSQLQRIETAFACRQQDPNEWERVMRDHGRQLLEEHGRLRELLLDPVGASVRAKHRGAGADNSA